MKPTLHFLLLAAALALPSGAARGDGLETEVYGGPNPYGGQPQYFNNNAGNGDEASPVYQAPPEGTCYDDSNQAYDCSNDPDYASYNQVDDGYDPSAYSEFQQALSPYGSWVESPEYGQVWTPSTAVVGADFSPYATGGHWAFTDYGWTWASDYDWGWAPFHYGRWATLGSYGWCWIPGRIWGPAWVHWRHGGGYVGWSALPPRGRMIPAPYGGHAGRWNFVPAPYLGAPRLNRVTGNLVPSLYARTASANVMRSIGTTRVNIGPLPGTLGLGHLTPSPLRTMTQSLPRAEITVRAGMPLQSRSYFASGRQAQTLGGQRYQQGYQHPGYQSPGYQHPGYQSPGYQSPGYQHPGYQSPGYQRPGYQSPGYQSPGYQHPGYQSPGYQRPGYQQPVFQRPSYQSPGYQHPSYQAPTYQRPGYQSQGFQRPAYQAPTYQRPAYQAPVFQRPSYSAPVFQRPSYSAPRSYSAPSRPSYSAPSYHSAPSSSGSRGFSSGGGGRSGGGGGGHHR